MDVVVRHRHQVGQLCPFLRLYLFTSYLPSRNSINQITHHLRRISPFKTRQVLSRVEEECAPLCMRSVKTDFLATGAACGLGKFSKHHECPSIRHFGNQVLAVPRLNAVSKKFLIRLYSGVKGNRQFSVQNSQILTGCALHFSGPFPTLECGPTEDRRVMPKLGGLRRGRASPPPILLILRSQQQFRALLRNSWNPRRLWPPKKMATQRNYVPFSLVDSSDTDLGWEAVLHALLNW